jgi:hypothetical protein
MGVDIGAGVGLHAKTACFYVSWQHKHTIPLVASADWRQSRPGPDVDQHRRSPGVVPAQMCTAQCYAWGAHDCVLVHARAVVCVSQHACLCMQAPEPTACMIWHMQKRAYMDVGTRVGVEDGAGVGVDVGAGEGVDVGAREGVDVGAREGVDVGAGEAVAVGVAVLQCPSALNSCVRSHTACTGRSPFQ